MKILLLSWNYPPALGGIEYVVENLFAGLRRHGHEVRLVTACAEDAPAEEGVHRARRRGLKRFVAFSLFKGLSLCWSFRPDVVVCGSIVTAPAGWALSKLFGVPCVLLMHGSDILHEGRLYQAAVRFLARRATRLAANSLQTKRLLERAGVRPAKIDVIHPGVRVEDFAAAPNGGGEEILSRINGRRVLLSVGRLIRRKGVLEFVQRIMPALVRDYPEVLLLVVGEDAAASLAHKERMKDRIARSVEELGLKDHVWLLGKVAQEDMVPLFRRADVLVLPCLDIPGDVEGFGIVFLEAALGGAPAVATRVGGIPEAVQHGKTGLLVPPEDDEAMRRAIAELFEDEDLRQRLAQQAADRARREFGWDAIVEQYEQTFKLIARR